MNRRAEYPSRRPGLADRLVISLAKELFFTYARLWLLKKRRAGSLERLVDVFYIEFLRLNRSHIEIVKLEKCELITRCRNPCPILSLSLKLSLDTRYVCRVVSEPVCRYVLEKLNPNLEFERNYSWIRPYAESCEERIKLKHCA